jgi:Carbamoyl-phosphate synthase L chain, ATP binding domain
VKPIVLLATTCRWVPVARLAMTMSDAGFTVEAVCPPGHPIGKLRAARKTYVYRGMSPLNSFSEAITATKPDIIIPGDDLAAEQLHALYARARAKDTSANKSICSLLEHSLGSPGSYRAVSDRATFMEIAEQEGIRVPKSAKSNTLSDIESCGARLGFPLVLKANGTSGGDGVRIVNSVEEASSAFQSLQAPPLLLRAIKRAALDGDRSLIWPSVHRTRFVVSAQSFIAGREATSLVACWRGRVLASLHFEVVSKGTSSGPASVLRAIENPEMSDAATKMVRRLNLSGLHGFDFMLEANTRRAFLIEINPRSTQVGHLAFGRGRDLSAALFSAVTGRELQEAPKITDKDTVALFPQEWLRDPESEFLASAYHDVPWEEPELVRMCINRSRKWIFKRSQRERIKAFWRLAGSQTGSSQQISRSEPVLAEVSKTRVSR